MNRSCEEYAISNMNNNNSKKISILYHTVQHIPGRICGSFVPLCPLAQHDFSLTSSSQYLLLLFGPEKKS